MALTGYSSSSTYQATWGSLSADSTVCDGNTATGVDSSHSPPNSVTGAIDIGSSVSIAQIDYSVGYGGNAPSIVLEWSTDHITWSTTGLPAVLPPPHGGVFSLWTASFTSLSITAQYLRMSVSDASGSAAVRELTIPATDIVVTEGAPGTDGSLVVFFQALEIAPGVDWWQTPTVDVFTVSEGSPGSDLSKVVYREIIIAETAPGHDTDMPFVPTVVWGEGAPGSDGTDEITSICTLRERSKYCPNGDGTYNTGYRVVLISQNNHVDIDPSTYITITGLTTVNNGFTLAPNNGIDVETPIEAAVSWWRPLTQYHSYRYANSSGAIGEAPPDDTLSNFIKGFLPSDDVAFGLRVVRTGHSHLIAGQIRSDGHGGHLFHLLTVDPNTPITDTYEQYWDAHVGDPQHVLISSQGVLGFHAIDSEECFYVNPFYDNTPGVENVGAAIYGLGSGFSGGNFGNFIYQLQATIWDTYTFTWLYGYYTYSIAMYSCCEGDCPPCTGPPPTIPSGSASVLCLASSFIDCAVLPGASSITGPEPFASACSIIEQRGCACVIQTHCLTQAQIDANAFHGPYTVRIPLTSKCLQAGGTYRCEMLVGTFYLSAGQVCDTGGVPSNPFNLQDKHGRYHATGGGGSYQRSNFGTNKSVGWATESTLSAPAGRSLHDLRVIVDDRQTVWAAYAQQKDSDSSWDGVYYRTSNDDGKTWEDAVLSIAGAKHPTIAIGTDGTFDVVVIAAYVGPVGGPGVITAKSKSAGDTDFSDAFNFKDDSDANLVAEDDTFHLQQARDDQSRWMLHIVIDGEGSSSQWTSFDEAKTWKRVT